MAWNWWGGGVRIEVLRDRQSQSSDPEVTARLLWGHLDEVGRNQWLSRDPPCPGGMHVWVQKCLRVPPIYSHVLSFLQRKLVFSQAPTPTRPSMTLNILSRRTSDPRPKEALTLTPVGP